MFDNLGNLPLHPLVVHAAVVGIPLAVLLAFLFAFPRTRGWARWPLAITVVGATGVTYVAKQSGLAFEVALGIKPGNPVGDLILQHSLLAEQLFWIMIVFAVVGLVNVFVVQGHVGQRRRYSQAARHRAHCAADPSGRGGGRCLDLDRPRRRPGRSGSVESDRSASVQSLVCDCSRNRDARNLRAASAPNVIDDVTFVTSITGR